MIVIRQLGCEADFTSLISLSGDFFQEYETHHPHFFKIDELKDEDVARYFSSFCNHESRKAFIAMDKERLVGYITVYVREQPDYWHTKQVGEISGLMVHKDYRRQGIAGKLLATVKSFLATQGVGYFTVYTATANLAGLEFYREKGLVPLYTTLLGEISPG